MAKGGLAKQRLAEKQRRNRIIAQLQGLKDQGFTDEQIRNAGNNAYQTLQGQTPTTATASPAGTEGAFQDAISEMTQSLQTSAPPLWMQTAESQQRATTPASTTTQPLQWWQRGNVSAPTSPFSGVSGSAGGTRQTRPPAYGGSYNPTTANGNTPTPYIPQWLAGRPPAYGGSYNPTAPVPAWVAGRAPAYGGSYNPTRAQGQTVVGRNLNAPGTVSSRRPNPLTGIPDFPMLSSLGDAPGYGYSWKKRRRGGGGGGGRSRYQPPKFENDRAPYIPRTGQANWSIG